MPSAVRGAALVGFAVIAGIIGLQILDDSGGSGQVSVTVTSSSTTSIPGASSTTTTAGGKTTTTRNPALGRPVSQVKVVVFNASGQQGAAQAMTNKLKSLGYNTQGLANAPQRTGSAVQCKSGFEKEATLLAVQGVGGGAKVEPYPKSPPSGADDADCLVLLGKTS